MPNNYLYCARKSACYVGNVQQLACHIRHDAGERQTIFHHYQVLCNELYIMLAL